MSGESVAGAIAHEIAALRAAFARVSDCRSALLQWKDGDETRYSLHLDIRAPERQILVSGPAHATAQAAIEAACRRARGLLEKTQ